MYVLYRELLSFDHLESYIAQNELDVIYSNVAISWAIHAQNLDESIDISNKTTTNIPAEEFCKSVDLGQYFSDNQETFHQQYAITWLKSHLGAFRKVYDHFYDEKSKDAYFSLLMYCLCPYTTRFFRGKLGTNPPSQQFVKNDMNYIVSNQMVIGITKPTLVLSLLYHFSQMSHLPSLLRQINPHQHFTLDLYQEDGKYRGIFTARPYVPEKVVEKPSVEEAEAPTKADPLADMFGQTAELQEDIKALEGMMEEISEEMSTVDPLEVEASLADLAEEMGILSEQMARQDSTVLEEKVEWDEGDVQTINTMLESIDVPQSEGTGATDWKVKALMGDFPPDLPPMDVVAVPRDTMARSVELLSTMEELVSYLKRNYPSEDPICSDLLDSMGVAVGTLQNILSPVAED